MDLSHEHKENKIWNIWIKKTSFLLSSKINSLPNHASTFKHFITNGLVIVLFDKLVQAMLLVVSQTFNLQLDKR
jgi:hypothetical protein